MWDNSTPLKLLQTMPKVLEDEHLEKLQMLLEADKYKNQLLSGSELCGTYAPFCDGCNKEVKYPCAVAYVNYLKEQGTDIDIAADSKEAAETVAEEITEEQEPAIAEEKTDDNEPVITEENSEEQEPAAVEETVAETEEEKPVEKTKIRIAIARKKTIL